MNKKAILKQHKTNSWEEEDVKRGRKLASEGKMGHAEALFDDAHGSYNWRGGNDGFEQKIDGRMGSFDVMSEPGKMSVSANKVNPHAAVRSKFAPAQTRPEVNSDSAATERLNAGIDAQNAAEARINEARNSFEKMRINRINAAGIGETISLNRPVVETTTTKKKK